jgi:hypothetical protein
MAFKYGRRAPKNAPALQLSSFLSKAVPAHPRKVDHLAPFTGWQMLGNDVAGDCNAVTWANMRRLVTGTLSTEYYPTQAQVWEFYQTQNPQFDPNGSAQTNGPGSPADNGMDVQTGLEYLQSNGGPDGVKAVAFAKVDHTKISEVEAALAIFGGLWLGITVLDANQQQFAEDEAWTDVHGSQIDGGHAILSGGFVPDITFITWAKETKFAPSFWDGVVDKTPLVEEAWVVIWPELLGSAEFLQGVDLTQLATDYQTLTGSVLDLPQSS